MKTLLVTILCVTAIVPRLAALYIVPKHGMAAESGRMQEAPDEDAAELDSAQAGYYNVANQVHSRITEVTNDTITDHQVIRMHWTITSNVSIWAFELRFTYFDENHNPFKIETRWMYSPNEDGSVSIIPPHSPIDDWHQLTVPTDQASKFKAVSVAVDIAYPPI
jgi:hypothetical protein